MNLVITNQKLVSYTTEYYRQQIHGTEFWHFVLFFLITFYVVPLSRWRLVFKRLNKAEVHIKINVSFVQMVDASKERTCIWLLH